MAEKFIKTIVDRINLATKKGLTGYWSPSQIITEVHAESMNLWKKYIDEFERTKKISLYLKPFEKVEDVTGLTGSVAEGTKTVTACHQYPVVASIAGNVTVSILTLGEYNYRFNHPTKGPDATHPICKFLNDMIFVAPMSDVSVIYVSKPIKPFYAVDSVPGDQYQYNDANTIDIEWDERLHDDIMNRVLANLGIPNRDGQMIQYSQVEKQQEGK